MGGYLIAILNAGATCQETFLCFFSTFRQRVPILTPPPPTATPHDMRLLCGGQSVVQCLKVAIRSPSWRAVLCHSVRGNSGDLVSSFIQDAYQN